LRDVLPFIAFLLSEKNFYGIKKRSYWAQALFFKQANIKNDTNKYKIILKAF